MGQVIYPLEGSISMRVGSTVQDDVISIWVCLDTFSPYLLPCNRLYLFTSRWLGGDSLFNACSANLLLSEGLTLSLSLSHTHVSWFLDDAWSRCADQISRSHYLRLPGSDTDEHLSLLTELAEKHDFSPFVRVSSGDAPTQTLLHWPVEHANSFAAFLSRGRASSSPLCTHCSSAR